MNLAPSHGRLAVRWIETALIHGEGDLYGQPFRLLPEQKLRLWRWYEFARTVDDLTGETVEEWLFRQALFGDPRGVGKTEFVAAIACLEFAGPKVFRRTTPIVTVAAASRDNANELFGQYAIMLGGPGDSVEEAPLCGQFLVFDTEIRYRDGSPGRIERIAAEASTAQGGKTTLFLADEVHEWTGKKATVHAVISTALDKRNGREINLTTAGPVRGSLPPKPTDPIAWKLYAKGLDVRHEPKTHPEFLFDWHDADARGFDLEDEADRRAYVETASGSAAGRLWDLDRRVGRWNDPELRHRDFRRYFGNEWVPVGAGSWLEDDPTSWQALEDGDVGIPEEAEVGLGVDMALRHDTAAVTLVCPLVDGRRLWRTRVFEAKAGRIDHVAILEHIDDLSLRFGLRVLAYDPRFFELPAQVLADRGFPVVEVPQSPERMGRAAELVYRQIRGGEIVHDGDPVLASHVEAGVWRETERGRMISKGRSLGSIDALVAGLLATYVLDLGDLDDDPEPDLAGAIW